MKRLIDHGLMYGNLIHIASPPLVERYNRALEHLTGRRTKLTDFYIDISGFSPEVGSEFDDINYLNQHGTNRQFILLSTEQRSAPLLNAKFSTSRDILRNFIQKNESQLFALTARDAVAGEMVNSVYSIISPSQLFDLRQITIEADTTEGTLSDAQGLSDNIDKFLKSDKAWFDDHLINQMIKLASNTGNITQNTIKLKHTAFKKRNFWTSHFGPLYLFRDVKHPALITTGSKKLLESIPMEFIFHLKDRKPIAHFLNINGLVEPILKNREVDTPEILRQKMNFILIDSIASHIKEFPTSSKREMRKLARRFSDKLPTEFHALADLVKRAEDGLPWPHIPAEHPVYFYTLRAARHQDADLVNMLLAELTPKDARQLFICHKDLFYAQYKRWPESQRSFMANFLAQEYAVDKIRVRYMLFGHDDPMEDPNPLQRMGPWGEIRG